LRQAAEYAVEFYTHLSERIEAIERMSLKKDIRDRANRLMKLDGAITERCEDKIGTMLADALDTIWQTAVKINQMADSVDQPFMLFVVDMGKYGKSTLINSLVGSRVADMGVLPKTWKIDIFTATRPQGSVLIKERSGRERQVSVEAAKEILAQEEKKYEESRAFINSELKKNLSRLETVEQKMEFRRLLFKRHLYESPISEVHWPCSGSRLLDKFNIIDTPGLFQELLSEGIQASLRDYYHKADGVLWLLDATKNSAKTPREMLDELDKALNEVGGRTDNIVAVLNRMDVIGDEPEVRKKVLDEAYWIFGGCFRQIVPFSARLALEAVEKGDSDLKKISGLDDLLQAIDTHFSSRAIRLRKESKVVGVKGYLKDAAIVCNQYCMRLEYDEGRREDLQQELTGKIYDFRDKFAKQAKDLLGTYRGNGITKY